VFFAVLSTLETGIFVGRAESPTIGALPQEVYIIPGGDALLNPNKPNYVKRMSITLTGYSSTVEETDDTPFITASGKHVRQGIVAANFLPFGTKIRIPELFGDEVFVVEDRMHRRHSDKIDIWFADKQSALRFGVQKTIVEVL